MKTTLITIIAVAAGVVAWQRHRLAELRGMEQALARGSAATIVDGGASARGAAPSPGSETMAAGLSEAEFARFTADLLAHRADFLGRRFERLLNASTGICIAPPSLCDPLRGLSSRQLRSVLEAWGGSKMEGVGPFLAVVRHVNPAALVQLYFDLRKEGREGQLYCDPASALEHWLDADPAGLWQWAHTTDPAVSGDEKCALWAAAADVLHTPNAATMRRLCAFRPNQSLGMVMKLLPSDEMRVQLLQILHAATGGNVPGIGGSVQQLTWRMPFSKLAAVADAVPSFVTPPFHRTVQYSNEEPAGNLRYEVALGSRDLTASDRWRWLVQRPADRPTGELLTHLVKEWCDHDFPDTGQWVKTLPPGPERDTAFQAVVAFLKWNRADDLVAEWEPQQR